MNDHEPLDRRLDDQRLVRALRGAARDVELRPGSELAVVARGRRRTARRRQAVALSLVTVVGGGTALAVQQLARTGDSSVATQEGSTPSEGTVLESLAPLPPPETVAPTPSPASGEIQPANLIEPFLEWNVVEPNSAEAVAYSNGGPNLSRVPGIMLATAPGANDDYVSMWWRTDDGINWQPLDIELPVGRPEQIVFDEAATMYLVGTAPGVAATEPNPLQLAVSNDEGTTWQLTDLGIDTNAGRELPFVSGISSYSQAVPVEGGAVVIVQRVPQLDVPTVYELAGIDPMMVVSTSPAGVDVAIDATCRDEAMAASSPTTTMVVGVGPPPDTVPATEPPATAPASSVPADLLADCETRLVAWDELGVPAETVDAVFQPLWAAFHVVDGVASEVALPEAVGPMGGFGTDGLTAGGEPRFFLYQPDGDSARAYRFEAGAFVETEPLDPFRGAVLGTSATTEFSFAENLGSFDGRFAILWSPVIAAAPIGGEAVYADWSGLYGPERVAQFNQTAVTDSGLVQVATVYADLLAAQGGVSATVDGVVISRTSASGPVEVRLESTGELVDPTTITFDDFDGAMLVPAGDATIRIASEELYPMVYYEEAIDYEQPSWTVAASRDGVNVAVESLADLLGVSDDEISSVPRISTDGTRTIIAVTMKERNAGGVPRQLVLVGTPK